ncbi:MAG: rane protein [Verrucomicrobiaceae bacterium]|nr:rane protein [Verrucomicrobiaceae bacterium]
MPLTYAAPQPDQPGKPESKEERVRKITEKIESFGWTRTGKGKLGTMAEIQIPPDYRFTGKAGCRKMLEFTHNIPGESELGVIAPEHLGWWVLFEYSNIGYVKDTDKGSLDADAILKTLQEGQEASNEERVKQGLDKLYLDGWAMPPRYNETTHNLEWAIKVRSDEGGTSINYLTKLLGRQGVMAVTLLVNPEALQSTLPDYQKLLTGFNFTQGQSYAEYRQGDKVAEYALTGLITAGAGIALAKTGWLAKGGILLAKAGKLVYVAVLGLFAGLKKLVMKLFGREKNDSQTP